MKPVGADWKLFWACLNENSENLYKSYVYVCIYTHTYMHTCIHTYPHTYGCVLVPRPASVNCGMQIAPPCAFTAPSARPRLRVGGWAGRVAAWRVQCLPTPLSVSIYTGFPELHLNKPKTISNLRRPASFKWNYHLNNFALLLISGPRWPEPFI